MTMKLGTQTGSLINHILSTAKARTPEIGEGATILAWTDRYAGTVIAVETASSGQVVIVTIQADDAKRVDSNGMSECQEYEYTRNEKARIWSFRLDARMASPKWVEVHKSSTGRWNKTGNGTGLVIGRRQKFHDYSF